MSKDYFCADCGTKLNVYPKVLKNLGKIIYLVDSHTCNEDNLSNIEDVKTKVVITPNDVKEEVKASNNLLEKTITDKRKEVKSIAPTGIVNQLRNQANSNPEGDIDL